MPNEVKIIVFADDLTVIAVAKNADMDYQRHKNVTADGPVWPGEIKDGEELEATLSL